MIRPDGERCVLPNKLVNLWEQYGHIRHIHRHDATYSYYVQFPFGFWCKPLKLYYNCEDLGMEGPDASLLCHAIMFIDRFRGRMK